MTYRVSVSVDLMSRDWTFNIQNVTQYDLKAKRREFEERYQRYEDFDCCLSRVLNDETLPDDIYNAVERAAERIDKLLDKIDEAIDCLNEAVEAWETLEGNLEYVFTDLMGERGVA